MSEKLKGFTLAEVLITLAIIGVVAALTIPTLISKYHKSIVETRLKQASAQLMHASKLSSFENNFLPREGFEYHDPDAAMEIFEKYYSPYIKFLKVEKGEKGVFGYFPDGSVVYFRRERGSTPGSAFSWGSAYCIICITAKSCNNINESLDLNGIVDGKDIFLLYTDGRGPSYSIERYTDDELVEQCKKTSKRSEACTALIGKNGWKIPDNYPIKF